MFRKIFYLVLPLSLLLPSWAPAPVSAQAPAAVGIQATASQRFAELAEKYWDAQMRLSPLAATFVNYPRYHDRLDDNSAYGRAQEAKEYNALLMRLEGVNRADLSESEQVSWDVMKLELERSLERPKHKFWQWNVDHMDGPQTWIATVVALAQPMKTADDAEALLLRMKALPGYFATEAANLRQGLGEGRIAARVPVEKAIRQIEEILKTPAQQAPYAAAARKLPKELQDRYLSQVLSAVESHVYPAYGVYLDFLKKEYLSRARKTNIGLSALPGGLEAYRYQIRYHTTVDKSPEELHQMGLDELKEIHAEMEAIARKMGHTGDLKSFMDKVRHDPKNFFTTREEVLKTAEEIVGRAKARLPEFFATLPKTPLLVRPIEDYKEKNDVAARYYEPSDDLTRPGIYFINTYEPRTRPRFSMTSLAAHEGVPGHHLQISLAMEKRDLPAFRRHGDFNAFVEGWALYCERLAVEMGLYQDELSRVGMLSDQALRASRLVVDTGLHAMSWSRQQAIDFMKDNTPMSEGEIVAEVDRYTIWPAQALSYKVGQREIMALRREAQARLGERFDIRKFHDDVLKNGALPLNILRQIILGQAAQ